ncbi:MAG: cobalt-precorrin-7 (C(5))-methyltransferase [Methanomassiliicoccales archaeon]
MSLIVVGVGCGPGFMTQYGAECIQQAKRVYGSARAIELAKPFIAPDCEVHVLQDYSNLDKLPEDAVLLSTGDPMLAGLGHLGTEVVPGISSMQLAFARLRLPLVKAVVVDGHNSDPSQAIQEAVGEAQRGRIPFILAKPGFDLSLLAKELEQHLPCCKIVTCEELGYPKETITFGTPKAPPKVKSGLFSVLVIRT